MSAPLVFTDVEKSYGGLRPLRVRSLDIPEGRVTMLLGLDRPTAEIFVNLSTGTTLPDHGAVVSLGRNTADIADSAEWLALVERFGLVGDRSVLLEAMTVVQNLALPFDLNIDAISGDVRARAEGLADEVDLAGDLFQSRVGDASPLVRARVQLARALAFDPEILLLEHPSAALGAEDATAYARTVQQVAGRRRLTVVGLLADERFARATGGRLLIWQPATGEFHERKRFMFW